MHAHIKLGRIFGIQIGLHYSWLIIALLVTLSLVGHFRISNPNWGDYVIWGTALVTAVLFFVAIVLHELSHALVALSWGLPVKSITLFALGGVAQIEKEAEKAKTEFWMAIVGPITSILIGVLCLSLLLLFGWSGQEMPDTPLMAMLMWLGVINILLAVFNMIPGFPLDGGRVLRSIIWGVTGDPAKSTRIASRVGQVVAFGFIIFGILRFFSGGGFGGLWLAFIGWFLLEAARATYVQVEAEEALRGVRVGDIMANDCPIVDSRDNLQTFVDERLLRTGQRCFVVQENGVILGILTPHEVRTVDRAKWPYTTVDEVMKPLDRLKTIGADAPVTEALKLMGTEDVNQLPVVSNGRLAGIVSRAHILRMLQTRAEFRN